MKLVVQIPCKNEEETIASVLQEIPKKIPGISEIHIVIIDDGSSDHTVERAKALWVKHIVSFKKNRGLGFAFKAGVEYALEMGADILVNTDGDNQYPWKYIPLLVAPILENKADIVIGDRSPWQVKHFTWYKRFFQKVGNYFLGIIVGEKLYDSVSWFRAYSRYALYEMNITTRFSYVIDTIIQAYKKGLKIVWVPIIPNETTRPSRLFKNIWEHIWKSTISILRVYVMYEPLKFFCFLSFPFLFVGIIGIMRFLYYHFFVDSSVGLIQSLVISWACITIGISLFSLGIVGDLIAKNRFLIEEHLKITKYMKYEKGKPFNW